MGLPAMTGEIKSKRFIACVIGIVCTFLGAVIDGAEEKVNSVSDDYTLTSAILATVLLALTHLYGSQGALIAAIGLTLAVSPGLTSNAHTADKADNGGEAFGDALVLIGVWLPWLVWDLDGVIGKLNGSLVAGTENIVAVALWGLNFLGCILMWAAEKNKANPFLDTSIQALLLSVLFFAAWYLESREAFFITLLYGALLQKDFLDPAVADSGEKVGQAGATFAWICAWGFMGLLINRAEGSGFAEVSAKIKGAFASKDWVIIGLFILDLVAIIGAFIVGDNKNDSHNWSSSTVIFAILFLVVAYVQTGERAEAFGLVVLGLAYVASASAVGNAVVATKNEFGYALLVIAIWTAFLLVCGHQPIIAGLQKVTAGTPHLINVAGFVFMFIGNCCLWAYSDDKTDSTSATLSVYAMFNSIFVFTAMNMDHPDLMYPALFILSFFNVTFFTIFLIFEDVASFPKRDTLLAGYMLVWISTLFHIIAVSYQLYLEPPASKSDAVTPAAQRNTNNGEAAAPPPAAAQDVEAPPPAYDNQQQQQGAIGGDGQAVEANQGTTF